MKHTFHRCDEDRCNVCLGDLSLCTVCNGAEASLPTECPGSCMTEQQEADIMSRKIDFVDGAWVPMHRRKGTKL